MKMKGIPIWEQYIEFIVLGVAVLAFAGLGAWSLLAAPTGITVDGEELAPGEIRTTLNRKSDELWARMRPDAPPSTVIDEPSPIAPAFLDRLNESVAPSAALSLSQERLALSTDLGPPPAGTPFVVPDIPAPHSLAQRQYFDGIQPEEVSHFDLAADYFPEGNPYDATWVTAAASFDLADVLRQMSTAGPGGTPHEIPAVWYGGKALVANVLIEREEKDGGAWTNRVILDPIKTQSGLISIREQFESFSAPARDTAMEFLSNEENQRQVIQPPFYSTLNSSWTIPQAEEFVMDEPSGDEESEEESEEAQEIRRLRRQITDLEKRIAALLNTIESLGGTLDNPPSGNDDDDSGGGVGGGNPGLGGGASRRGDDDSARDDMKRYRQTMRLRRMEGQLEGLREELEALTGFDDSEEVVVDETSIFDRETLRVWGHDMDVIPGREYRYRFTVQVLNPFFGRAISLIDDQQYLALQPVLSSETSDWGDPIKVLPPIQAFIVSADAAQSNVNIGRRGMGQANAEIFKFQNGRWWSVSFNGLEPGQRVGGMREVRSNGQRQDIDFTTDWYILDIVPDMTSSNTDRGGNGMVILQHMDAMQDTDMRRPRQDANMYRRDELNDQVELAELQEELNNIEE